MAGRLPYTAYPTKSIQPSPDIYGSPEAPVIQTYEETFYLPPASCYPNALYFIKPFSSDTIYNVDDTMHIENDQDIRLRPLL
jgi:hypothetical protein